MEKLKKSILGKRKISCLDSLVILLSRGSGLRLSAHSFEWSRVSDKLYARVYANVTQLEREREGGREKQREEKRKNSRDLGRKRQLQTLRRFSDAVVSPTLLKRNPFSKTSMFVRL